jgi:hypothetical protein
MQNRHACPTVLLNKIKNATSSVAGMNAKDPPTTPLTFDKDILEDRLLKVAGILVLH